MVATPSVKSIPRLAQRFIGEAAIVLREPDLADGGFQLDQRRANFLFDATALIGEFGLSLMERGFRLLDVSLYAAPLENRHVDGSHHRINAVIGNGSGSQHSVIGGEGSGGKALGARGGHHDFSGVDLALGGLQTPALLERLLDGGRRLRGPGAD